MKRIMLMIVLFLGVAAIPAISATGTKQAEQADKNEPTTKLEQFMSKKGRLYIKDYYDAGRVSGNYGQHIKIDALVVYEPGKEAEKNRGLKIEVYEGGRLEKSHSSFLDLEEVESLSKAIDYMSKLIDKLKLENREYTEVIFATKGGFKIGFYQKDKQFTAFAESGVIGSSHCFLETKNLGELREAVDKGLTLAKK